MAYDNDMAIWEEMKWPLSNDAEKFIALKTGIPCYGDNKAINSQVYKIVEVVIKELISQGLIIK